MSAESKLPLPSEDSFNMLKLDLETAGQFGEIPLPEIDEDLPKPNPGKKRRKVRSADSGPEEELSLPDADSKPDSAHPIELTADGNPGYLVRERPEAMEWMTALIFAVRGWKVSEKEKQREAQRLLASAAEEALEKLRRKRLLESPLGSVTVRIENAEFRVRIMALFEVDKICGALREPIRVERRLLLSKEAEELVDQLIPPFSGRSVFKHLLKSEAAVALRKGEKSCRLRWYLAMKGREKTVMPVTIVVPIADWMRYEDGPVPVFGPDSDEMGIPEDDTDHFADSEENSWGLADSEADSGNRPMPAAGHVPEKQETAPVKPAAKPGNRISGFFRGIRSIDRACTEYYGRQPLAAKLLLWAGSLVAFWAAALLVLLIMFAIIRVLF